MRVEGIDVDCEAHPWETALIAIPFAAFRDTGGEVLWIVDGVFRQILAVASPRRDEQASGSHPPPPSACGRHLPLAGENYVRVAFNPAARQHNRNLPAPTITFAAIMRGRL